MSDPDHPQYPFERSDAYPVAVALFARVGTLGCPLGEREKLERAAMRIVTSVAEAVEVNGQPALRRPWEVARVSCVRAVALLDGLRAMGFVTRAEDFETRTYLVALFGFLADLRRGVLTRAGAAGALPA